jgi:AAA+ superfamily predicted ATPase
MQGSSDDEERRSPEREEGIDMNAVSVANPSEEGQKGSQRAPGQEEEGSESSAESEQVREKKRAEFLKNFTLETKPAAESGEDATYNIMKTQIIGDIRSEVMKLLMMGKGGFAKASIFSKFSAVLGVLASLLFIGMILGPRFSGDKGKEGGGGTGMSDAEFRKGFSMYGGVLPSQCKGDHYKGLTDEFNYFVQMMTQAYYKDEEDSGYWGGSRTCSKNIMLFGLPGTGKTFFVKNLVYLLAWNLRAAELMREHEVESLDQLFRKGDEEYNSKMYNELKKVDGKVEMYCVNTDTFSNMYFGESEKRMHEFFAFSEMRARMGKLVIVFIDEADTILVSRGERSISEGTKALSSILLRKLDGSGTNPDENIFYVASTNYYSKIDKGFIRRFGIKLGIPLPGKEKRFKFSRMHISPFIHRVSRDQLNRLVDEMEGYSMGDMQVYASALASSTNNGAERITVEEAAKILQDGKYDREEKENEKEKKNKSLWSEEMSNVAKKTTTIKFKEAHADRRYIPIFKPDIVNGELTAYAEKTVVVRGKVRRVQGRGRGRNMYSCYREDEDDLEANVGRKQKRGIFSTVWSYLPFTSGPSR